MPSHLHEALLLLFRNQPALVPELIRQLLGGEIPGFGEARVVEADLTDIQPAEYRADMVIELFDGSPVFAIILEVQLSENKRKHFVWPAYVANLRARLECPVCLLVFTVDEATARWAAKPVEIGGQNQFRPYVLGPSGMPEVVDEERARANPELAVLSAMAHGRDADVEKSLRIAKAAHQASAALDVSRSRLYCDLIMNFLGEAARTALEKMDPQKYEYLSEFARRYVAQGKAEGKAEGIECGQTEGRAALIVQQLKVRFGVLGQDIETRIRSKSAAELHAIGVRLLSARTLDEALEGSDDLHSSVADLRPA